jgi:hypothetical protein
MGETMTGEPTRSESTGLSAIGPTTFHPLSAWITILLDLLWLAIEIPETLSVVGLALLLPTSVFVGLLCFAAVTAVQRFLAGDPWGAAAAKGLVLGIAAGLPYPVVGTAAGVSLLAWARLSGGQKSLPSSGAK